MLFRHRIDVARRAAGAGRAEAEPVPLDPAEPLRAGMPALPRLCPHRRAAAHRRRRGLAVLASSLPRARSRDAQRPVRRAAGPTADSAGVFVHESPSSTRAASIGAGTRIWHFCHVLGGARIGRDCVIGQNVMIGPDVAVGDHCKIQNNVSLYQGVTLEDGVFCGPSCVFTNVLNPRAEIERKDEFRADPGAARRDDRRQCHDRLRPHARRVLLRRAPAPWSRATCPRSLWSPAIRRGASAGSAGAASAWGRSHLPAHRRALP